MRFALKIDNYYELYDMVVTTPVVDVPAPPSDLALFDDWLYDHIYPQTGVGNLDGNSSYFVEVLECDDPKWVGAKWEFGT